VPARVVAAPCRALWAAQSPSYPTPVQRDAQYLVDQYKFGSLGMILDLFTGLQDGCDAVAIPRSESSLALAKRVQDNSSSSRLYI